MSKVKDRPGRGLSRGRNAVVHNRETLRHERDYKWPFAVPQAVYFSSGVPGSRFVSY